MEVVPGKKLRSWHHPFLFQWLPSSELALVSVGSRAERRWFPIVSTLLPGMLSAFGAWSSASRSICSVWPEKSIGLSLCSLVLKTSNINKMRELY